MHKFQRHTIPKDKYQWTKKIFWIDAIFFLLFIRLSPGLEQWLQDILF